MTTRLTLIGVALLAALVLLHAAPAAQAQSTVTLVSNTGKSESSDDIDFGLTESSVWLAGQPFTTGTNSTGYTLSAVDLKLGATTNSGLRVSVYSATSAGLPDRSLHVLTNPATLTASAINTFTAASGTTLDANTTYVVVLASTGTGNPLIGVRGTSDTGEDSGAASGWSIGDSRVFKSGSDAWQTPPAAEVAFVAIKGTVKPPAGNPPASTTPRRNRCTGQYCVECADGSSGAWGGYWHVTNKFGFGMGDRAIACDMAKPGWASDPDPNRIGHIIWVYDDRPRFWDQGNPPPPVNQPLADGTPYTAFTYAADASNRAVRGADGSCYREQRVSGGWERSDPYRTDPNNWMAACQQASWNAYYRSQRLFLIDPAGGTFPSGAPHVPGALQAVAVDGKTLTLTFHDRLDTDSAPSPGAFRVTVNDALRNVASGGVAVSGKTVTLTLASAVDGGDTVKVRYTRPPSRPLRTRAGTVVPTFADRAVPNNTGGAFGNAGGPMTLQATASPPSVTGVSVVSDAGADKTYALGETIRVRAAFDRAVEVTGAPRLGIDMDPAFWGEKWAPYESGSGTDSLTFAHTVVEPNLSTQGIAVLANSLALNGGTIREGGIDAVLAHDGLAHDANHKVDWQAQPAGGAVGTSGPSGNSGNSGPPTVSALTVISGPGAGDAYLLGDTIRIRATFSEAVTVTGTPTLSIDMDPAAWGTKQAAYESGSGTTSLTFAHTVVEPNLSTQGIAVLANTLQLSGGTIRSGGGANAALGHSGLAHDSGHKVDWRPDISVADARAHEGAGASVAFVVSLSRAFSGTEYRVTVDYATSNGTATAGVDYKTTSGTLTFATGEQTKTVNVPVLDDSHDEGEETVSLGLSNATGARIGDGEATGTIVNTDPMPRAWLARFGRTLAEQVVDAVGARLAAPRGGGAQARLAGQELAAGSGLDADESARLADQELARWLAGTPEQPRTMSGGELLAGSAFAVTSAAAEGGPSAALWGRGGWSRFEGREGSLSVDGEVTTALLGAEAASRAWLGGVMLSHARGDGSYRDDAGAGTVTSALTAVHPYVGVDLSERLTAWAAGGLGLGALTLTPDGAAARETDLSLLLAALGARGRLVEPAAGSGFSLAIETDAYWVRTSSAAAAGLAEAQTDATRIRLGLDGGYRIGLDGGGTLEPTVAVGVRHDGGHAETGYGMDLGGGLAWSEPALGLSAQVAARGLLTGAFNGFRDLGLSGSLAWDPDPASDRGPSLSVTQTLGAAATGGSHALLGRPTAAGLAATDDGLDRRRLDLRAGYGFAAAGDRFTMTPELGLGLSDTGRDYTLGWRLGLAQPAPASFELGIEATRSESAGHGAEHDLGLTMTASW